MRSTIIPHLVIRNASAAVDFYREVFGFEQNLRLPTPDGKIMHCSLRLGGQDLFLCDEMPGMGDGKAPGAAG